MKIGVMDDVPLASFKTLCMAFESNVRICQINSWEGKITLKKLAGRMNAVLRHNYKH